MVPPQPPGDAIHLDRAKLSRCVMERVICHWTAGHYEPSSSDCATYHILVDRNGEVRYGTHPIEDNVSTGTGNYAPHTIGCNAGSIGVACCAMHGSREQPFDPRAEPMTERQWRVMCEVVAELCLAYSIKVTDTTVLGHGEVLHNLGVPQAGSWDPMVWPWEPKRTRAEVGKALRGAVQKRLEALENSPRGSAAAALKSAVACAVRLRSDAFANQLILAQVLEGHRVLRASSGLVAGVAAVQRALHRLGADTPAYRIDLGVGDAFSGYFGENTERAVAAFQADHGLPETGVIGQKTIVALDREMLQLEARRSAADSEAS